MPVMFKDGQILFDNTSNKIAFDSNCCCEDGQCPSCSACCNAAVPNTMYFTFFTQALNVTSCGAGGTFKNIGAVYSPNWDSGTCTWRSQTISPAELFVTAADVSAYYAPNGIDVQAGDTFYLKVFCTPTTLSTQPKWKIQAIVASGPRAENVAFTLTARAAFCNAQYHLEACPTRIVPVGHTGVTWYHPEALGASRPRVNGGVWMAGISIQCTVPEPPVECDFNPVTDCPSVVGTNIPSTVYTYLRIANWQGPGSSLWSTYGCETFADTASGQAPWDGFVFQPNPSGDCRWYSDTAFNADKTVGGYTGPPVYLGRAEILPFQSSGRCGWQLLIRCRQSGNKLGSVIWQGLYETNSSDPRGSYTEISLVIPSIAPACMTNVYLTQLQVTTAVAKYSRCSGNCTQLGVRSIDSGSYSDNESPDGCSRTSGYIPPNSSLYIFNNTTCTAKLLAVSLSCDDDLAVNGISFLGCGTPRTITNQFIYPWGVPPNAYVRLNPMSWYRRNCYIRGTIQWVPVDDPALQIKALYIGGKGQDFEINPQSCYRFSGWDHGTTSPTGTVYPPNAFCQGVCTSGDDPGLS